jgi:hypothetical protein
MNSGSHCLAGLRGARRAAIVVAAAFALAGCVETAAELSPADAPQHVHLVRRPDVSLTDATVAFVSVDGAPSAISANFMSELAKEAAAQQIAIADPKKAHYFVRGYLSAYETADGAAIEYVWDIFTKDKSRAQRLSDFLEVKGQGTDAWTVAGDAALASVAAKSADDLAAFLSNTPEAVADSKKNKASSSAAALLRPAAEETKALGYAPVE